MNIERLSHPQWAGMERGSYLCSYGDREVELNLEEAVMLRRVECLLQRVVDGDASLCETSRTQGKDTALSRAWKSLEVATTVRFEAGEWKAGEVGFYLTDRDCRILGDYMELLKRLEVAP